MVRRASLAHHFWKRRTTLSESKGLGIETENSMSVRTWMNPGSSDRRSKKTSPTCVNPWISSYEKF